MYENVKPGYREFDHRGTFRNSKKGTNKKQIHDSFFFPVLTHFVSLQTLLHRKD